MNRGTDVVGMLLKQGISKYRISKQLGVSWNTINRWSRGQSKPRQMYAITLEKMLTQAIP